MGGWSVRGRQQTCSRRLQRMQHWARSGTTALPSSAGCSTRSPTGTMMSLPNEMGLHQLMVQGGKPAPAGAEAQASRYIDTRRQGRRLTHLPSNHGGVTKGTL